MYITPASYLTLLEGFRNLMAEQQFQIRAAIERYRNGLHRLAQASDQVNKMQAELSELQPKLVEASRETDAMMLTIEKESAQVEKASALVRADEVAANQQAAESTLLKAECQADLAEALPALEAALAALDTLKPTDITLVKSMKNPPRPVKTVLAAVCVMKDIKPEKIQDPAGSGKKILDFWGPRYVNNKNNICFAITLLIPSIAQLVERWTVAVVWSEIIPDIHRSLVQIRLEGKNIFPVCCLVDILNDCISSYICIYI